jgi:hypothetical protein
MKLSNMKSIVTILNELLCNRNLESENDYNLMLAGKSILLPETLDLLML